MQKDFILDLINNNNECEWIEFKENWFNPEQLGEYISSLSNGAALKGQPYGYFIWGVQDKTRTIVGTSFNYQIDYKKEPLENYLARNLNPSIHFKFEDYKDLGLVVLKIPCAEKYPTSFNGKRFLRIDSSKACLYDYPYREVDLFKVLSEGKPSLIKEESNNQELTFGGLLTYYASKGIYLNNDTYKKNLKLITNDKYNKLAELLSDQNPYTFRISTFAGKTKADVLYSVKDYGYKCILLSLEEILSYFEAINIPQADEENRKVERLETLLFDPDAIREAIVNAVVHNKWIDGNAPQIAVFTDRIEILSHGGIPFGQTQKGFLLGESKPVNNELSDIFLQLHISERTGRGVPTIIKAFGEKSIRFEDSFIIVTIPYNFINSINTSVVSIGTGVKNEGIKEGITEGIKLYLNRNQERILNEIRNNPNITTIMLVNKLNVSDATVERALAFLKKNSIIKRIGSNKTGYWKVLK